MIYCHIAYCPDQSNRNMGKELNKICSKYNDDDWIIFLDHDAIWTTDKWYQQIQAAIDTKDKVGMFTCMTNRVMNTEQLYRRKISENHDMSYHRKVGADLYKAHGSNYYHLTKGSPVSGVVMIVNCGIMKKIKFRELDSPLGVDNYAHFDLVDAGYKVGLLKGLYVYHWYRGDKNYKNTSHLVS